ncbi:hypothetical protein [Sulfuriferula multivorans]|uniref:hypothetical protein n=1 Tax=Sulfuriferula multivorans TaxID=1559896 RepID=UPI000F5C0015|nr:hypothetical protein [Sulfuriferula multivorans]
MGFFWDAIKAIGIKNGGEISSLIKADSIINEVTGINPRGYHSRMYAVVNAVVSEKYDYYYKCSNTPLNVDEVAFYKLMFLLMFANEEGYETAKNELRNALSEYRLARKDLIRPQIIGESWELTF